MRVCVGWGCAADGDHGAARPTHLFHLAALVVKTLLCGTGAWLSP